MLPIGASVKRSFYPVHSYQSSASWARTQAEPTLRPMKPQLNFVIGLRVRHARESAGLTQEKLAELVDRTKEAISNIERGVNYPALETLHRIADAVGVPLSLLLEESSGSNSYNAIKSQIDIKIRSLTENDLRFLVSMIDGLIAYKSTKD